MIDWISVETRLPDDRRRVFVWVEVSLPLGVPRRAHAAISRCNVGRHGASWDIGRERIWFASRVTHWSDIEGPTQTVAPPPKKP